MRNWLLIVSVTLLMLAWIGLFVIAGALHGGG